MVSVLISVLVISLIASALATMIVIAERFILNYGPCDITINKEKKITVQGGQSLLSTLTENEIFIPSACGGRGTCGLCKLKVLDGGGAVLPTERPFLEKDEIENNIRLSCQIKVKNDISIEIPEELFNCKQYTTVCAEVIDLTYDIKLFRFKLTDPPEINYKPGQYIQLQTPAYEKCPESVYRAYSMASNAADKSIIDLIIRRVPNGICTTYCFDYLKKGDTVMMNGPYGKFNLSDTNSPVIFIAGGSGMAPFVSLLHQMRNENNQRKVEYYFGGNTEKDIFLAEKMKEFEKDLPNFKFIPVINTPETNWTGEKGLVTNAVERQTKDATGYEGYLCGSPGMIAASKTVLTKLGIPENKIYYDSFA